jgi:hypothetical protein
MDVTVETLSLLNQLAAKYGGIPKYYKKNIILQYILLFRNPFTQCK